MQLNWADRLRNVATFLVVAVHVAAPVAMDFNDYHSFWWRCGNFWNSLARPGVPIFVMLSGFLILRKDEATGSFLKKRFVRVLVPALFWMVAYSFYNFQANGSPTSAREFFVGLFEGPVHYHLWFIYLILGLYLMFPILRPWVRSAREADFFYLFGLCALASWGYKICSVFFGLHFGLQWEFFTNNIGYFVLGYYLGTKPLADFGHGTLDVGQTHVQSPKSNIQRLQAWNFSKSQMLTLALLLISVGTAGTMWGSFWAKTTTTDAEMHKYFYDYLTPNVGMAAIGWFLLVRHLGERPALFEVEKLLSAASFGIYFLHVMVLDWLSEIGYWHSMRQEFFVLPGILVLAFGFSFLFVLLIRVLPFGSKIT